MSQEFYETDRASTRHVADRAVSSWDIDAPARLQQKLENYTNEAGSEGRVRITRVPEDSHRTIAELKAERDWAPAIKRWQPGGDFRYRGRPAPQIGVHQGAGQTDAVLDGLELLFSSTTG